MNNNSNKHKIIGVLGGMGPYATTAFMNNIFSLTKAKKDWDYPRLIIDNHTKIPSRSRHILYGEESPVEEMIIACKQLSHYPVDIIAIPCNSACCFVKEVQKSIEIPIINIIEITSNSLSKKYSGVKNCAVISGVTQYRTKSYKDFLGINKIDYIHHNQDIQDRIEQLIEDIKLNPNDETNKNMCDKIIVEIKREYQVDSIILGCTEFSCIKIKQYDFPILDSSLELAQYISQLNN
tara:strand:- start:32563 stop:33270 length:708 start_codon:yes stop_codon:yes gene_type:complete